jgi:hypothetical protein
MAELNGHLAANVHASAETAAPKMLRGSLRTGGAIRAAVRPGATMSGKLITADAITGQLSHGVGVAGGELSDITVRSQQTTFVEKPADSFYGIGSVTVEGDEDLIPANIKDGVTILGVTGEYSPDMPDLRLTAKSVRITENGDMTIWPPDGYVGMSRVTATVEVPVTEEKVDAVMQTKSVTPGKEPQTVEPDKEDGYNALEVVHVAGDPNLIPANIKDGVTIFGVTGEYENTVVVDAELQAKTVTPGASPKRVEPDAGYDGLTEVYVEGDSDLIPANIREGATIFGVSGSYSSGQKYQTKTVTPNRDGFPVTADDGYNALAQVIVNGDDRLVPGNIAEGVTIFGVTGEYVSPMRHIEVMPSIDEQLIFPADGYKGFSSITVLPVVSSDDYYDGWGQGYTAGYLAAGGKPEKERIYNGIRLPKLPEYDAIRYPYAYISDCAHQLEGWHAYGLKLCANPPVWVKRSSGEYWLSCDDDVLSYCFDDTVSVDWYQFDLGTNVDVININHYRTSTCLIWTNTDTYDFNGNLRLQKTEPQKII